MTIFKRPKDRVAETASEVAKWQARKDDYQKQRETTMALILELQDESIETGTNSKALKDAQAKLLDLEQKLTRCNQKTDGLRAALRELVEAAIVDDFATIGERKAALDAEREKALPEIIKHMARAKFLVRSYFKNDETPVVIEVKPLLYGGLNDQEREAYNRFALSFEDEVNSLSRNGGEASTYWPRKQDLQALITAQQSVTVRSAYIDKQMNRAINGAGREL